MSVAGALVLFLLLMLVALVPIWPWSRGWSYRPAIAFALLLTGAILLWITVFI